MTRLVNAVFGGTPVADVDVDAPTFKRTPQHLAGDVALTHDIVTGKNSISSTVTVVHNGESGRGCPLGLPLVNQYIGADMVLATPAAKDASGGVGDTIIAPYVLFLPTGEDTLHVAVYGSFHERFHDMAHAHVQVYDSSMVLITDEDMTFSSTEAVAGEGSSALTVTISDLTPGLLIVFISARTDQLPTASDIQVGFIRSVSIHHGRKRNQAIEPFISQAVGIWEPSATQGVAHRDFDTDFFDLLQPISAYELVGINRNINGLKEFISGAPAGNGSYTHEDHDGGGAPDDVNPARSRFDAHTQSSVHPDEPEVEFPVWAATFGAFLRSGKFVVDLAEPPTMGMLDFYAPWPQATSAQEISKTFCFIPDFQTASSNLKLVVLLGSESSPDVGDWTVKGKIDGTTSTGSAPVAIDADDNFWLSQESGLAFTPDEAQQCAIVTERSGAKTGIGEMCVLAACLYFDPVDPA